jgi:uncharacterized C2H2 Zn-finger protein
MNDECCPKCGSYFPAERAWAHRSVGMLLVAQGLQDLDTRVRCPNCSLVFQASEYRFFGFVPPSAMRPLVGVFILGFVLACGYFLVLA